ADISLAELFGCQSLDNPVVPSGSPEGPIVNDNRVSVGGKSHIEFDTGGAIVDRSPKRRDSVLWSNCRSSPMTDDHRILMWTLQAIKKGSADGLIIHPLQFDIERAGGHLDLSTQRDVPIIVSQPDRKSSFTSNHSLISEESRLDPESIDVTQRALHSLALD